MVQGPSTGAGRPASRGVASCDGRHAGPPIARGSIKQDFARTVPTPVHPRRLPSTRNQRTTPQDPECFSQKPRSVAWLGSAGVYFVERHAERELIAAMVHATPCELLGSH